MVEWIAENADSFDVNYTVVNDLKPVNSVSVDVVQPVTGENVSYQITLPADAPYEISTEYDAKGMKM